MTRELYVDPQRCQGHARCWSIAPDTFGIDEDGYAYVLPGREHAVDEEHVQKAIRNCPERTISIRDVASDN